MKTQQVLNKITHAFGAETFPEGVELFVPSAAHVFDVQKAVAGLHYETWNKIPLEILIRNRDRMTYLTECGFRFLLPAFLTAAIAYPRQVDVLRDNIIFLLVPPATSGTDMDDHFLKRAKALSNAQAEAILDFFESYTDIYPVTEWSYTSETKARIQRAMQFWRSKIDTNVDK
ncbi:MAG: hypothetical protein K8I30_23375 [Anaerolineae bacterium]|nr:hypothetical protein [Anaerolineae bacterium]